MLLIKILFIFPITWILKYCYENSYEQKRMPFNRREGKATKHRNNER